MSGAVPPLPLYAFMGFVRKISFLNCNVLLTVHLSITLANDQLDAQFLFTILFLQSPTCFEQRRAHHQEVKLY